MGWLKLLRRHCQYSGGSDTLTLQYSLVQVLDDLRMIALDATAEEQAGHLARHVAQFGLPDLCGEHGLPIYHYSRYMADVFARREHPRLGNSCPRSNFPGRETLGIMVLHVVRFINFLDALADACESLGRRRKVPERVVEDLLALHIIPDPPHMGATAPVLPMETDLNPDQARYLVGECLDSAMRTSGVGPVTTWATKQRPQITLRSSTNVGLYVLATVARIGMTSQDDVFSCFFCQQTYTPRRHPRPSERLCCPRTECQKRRRAENQRAYAARKK